MEGNEDDQTATNQQASQSVVGGIVQAQSNEKKSQAFYSPRLLSGGGNKMISLPIEEEQSLCEDKNIVVESKKKESESKDKKKAIGGSKLEEKKEGSQPKQTNSIISNKMNATATTGTSNTNSASNQSGLKKTLINNKVPPTKSSIAKIDPKQNHQDQNANQIGNKQDSQNNSTTNIANQQAYSKQNSQTNKASANNNNNNSNEPAALYNAKGNGNNNNSSNLQSMSLVQPSSQSSNKQEKELLSNTQQRQQLALKSSPPPPKDHSTIQFQKGEKSSQNRQSLNATPNSNTKTTSDEKNQELLTQVGFSNSNEEKMGGSSRKEGEGIQDSRGKKMGNGGDQDDDFIEDFLDDSMELQESNIIGKFHKEGTSRKLNASRIGGKQEKLNDINCSMNENKESSAGVGGRVQMQQYSNKIYQTSPSKLNQKFQVTLQAQNKISQQPQPSAQTQSSNQAQKQQLQNPKTSSTVGKKSIQNLQEQSKPITLIDLNLSMTNMAKLNPQQVSNQNIRSIDLRSNRLQEIPNELFELANLWKLQLDNNQLTTLPDLFSNLKGLKFFTVSNNQLEEIPLSVYDAYSLERLDFSVNKIQKVSGQIYKLQKLKYFFVQDNMISELPINISQLKCLTQLGIEWFLYLRQNGEKIIKKAEIAQQSLISTGNSTSVKQSSSQSNAKVIQDKFESQNSADSKLFDQVFSIFSKLNQSLIGKDIDIIQQQEIQLSFVDFLLYFYKAENLMDLFNSHFVFKQSTILHLLCKYNHFYLYDSIVNPSSLSQEKQNNYNNSSNKEYIDVNLQTENNETPLMISLNEKNTSMIERLLRDFGNQIDFEETGNSPFFSHELDKSLSSSPQKLYFMSQAQHPLMIAIKKQLLDVALKILALMLKKQSRLKQGSAFMIDLNIKDEQRNTMIHHLFSNFSSNMEMSVELLQELLKLGEKYYYQEGGIQLNESNKQGYTAIDIAVEIKQNQALEFAIYYNKNLLPALSTAVNVNVATPSEKSPNNNNQQQVKIVEKSKFNLNCNSNQRGLTPIHRAILNQNYKAIYLLLSSGECNLFLKDKEFKTPRDYCQRVMFLSKYIRKGEDNYLRLNLFKRGAVRFVSGPTPKDLKLMSVINKTVTHNNLNLFQLSKRTNRIKYNSWYTRLEQRNMLSSSQQPTIERQKDGCLTEEGMMDLEEVKLEDMKDEEEGGDDQFDGFAQVEVVDKDDDFSQIEQIDENEEGKLNIGGGINNNNVTNKKSLINEMVVSVKSSVLDMKKKDSNSKLQQAIPSFISSSALLSNQKIPQSQPQNSGKKNVADKKQSATSANGGGSSKQDSRTGFQGKRDSLQGNGKDNANNPKNSFNSTTTKDQLKNAKGNNGGQQNQKEELLKPRPSTITPLTLGVKDVDSSMSELLRKNQSSSEYFVVSSQHQEKGKKVQQQQDEEDDEQFSDVENEEKECPANLLSMQNQYVMVANSSKLARKPYYKQLQKNKYEREFCYLLDSKVSYWDKYKKLYQFYIEVHSSSECYLNDLKDARDMLRFLKLELEGKDQMGIQGLRMEICYLLERLQIQLEKPGLAVGGANNGFNFSNQRKNTNYSSERNQVLPLPSIQEISCEQIGNVVNSRSLLKKNSNSSNGGGAAPGTLQYEVNQANNNRGRIQSSYNTPAVGGGNIAQKSNGLNQQQKVSTTNKQINAGVTVVDRINSQVTVGELSTQQQQQTTTNNNPNLRLNSNSSQKSLEGFSSQKQANGNANVVGGTQNKSNISISQNYGLKQKNNVLSSRNNNAFSSQNQQIKQQGETGQNTREQQPTSPRATSSQIQSKALVPNNNNNNTAITDQRNSISQQNQKSKDACIKKIEVKLKDPAQQLAQNSSQNNNNQSSSQQQQTQSDQQQKWKQLTINPNAPPNNSTITANNTTKIPTTNMSNIGGASGGNGVSLSVGKQMQKSSGTNPSSNYNSNPHKVSTPQSQKINGGNSGGTPSNSSTTANAITVNVIGGSAKQNIRSINNSNLTGAGLIQQQQTKQGSGVSTVTGGGSIVGGGSSMIGLGTSKNDSQQNRSNSNPRNSILNANATLQKQGGIQEKTGTTASSNTQSIGGSSQIQLQSFDSSGQQQQEAPYSSSNGSIVSASNIKGNSSGGGGVISKSVVSTMQSKLKGPTKIGGVSGKQNNVSKTSK